MALQKVIDANKKAGRYISYQFLSRFIGAVDAKWALAISAGQAGVAAAALTPHKHGEGGAHESV
eukprot:scaffold5863_cov105-Isochrysis_galbana.AAC.2